MILAISYQNPDTNLSLRFIQHMPYPPGCKLAEHALNLLPPGGEEIQSMLNIRMSRTPGHGVPTRPTVGKASNLPGNMAPFTAYCGVARVTTRPLVVGHSGGGRCVHTVTRHLDHAVRGWSLLDSKVRISFPSPKAGSSNSVS